MHAAFIVLAAAIGFALGIVFHKNVVSETAIIKAHVTAEVFSLESRLKRVIEQAAQKV